MTKQKTATLSWLCGFAAKKGKRRRSRLTSRERRDAAREAHYRRNFFEYDGSEQEEYHE